MLKPHFWDNYKSIPGKKVEYHDDIYNDNVVWPRLVESVGGQPGEKVHPLAEEDPYLELELTLVGLWEIRRLFVESTH